MRLRGNDKGPFPLLRRHPALHLEVVAEDPPAAEGAEGAEGAAAVGNCQTKVG